jgi:alpha-L-arabinofuranosidase
MAIELKRAPARRGLQLQDALLVGGLVNSLLRNADRVKIACLAQLVNVIAPITTDADGLFQQTIYYPYSWGVHFARGAVLNLLVECPTYDVQGMDAVPYLDVAGTIDQSEGKVSLFVLNRDLSNDREVELVWEEKSPTATLSSWLLTGDDLKASNSFSAPQKVAPQVFIKPPSGGSTTKFEVPAHSYAVLQWSI